MKQHLLRVEHPVVEFECLITALRHEGERTGWLELPAEAAEPLPDSLSAAARVGVMRAVTAGGGYSVAIKPMRGEPVLRDLLREHFRGCRLVLIMGEIDAPQLEPDRRAEVVPTRSRAEGEQAEQSRAEGEQVKYWRVKNHDDSSTRWTTENLIAALRKSRPFGSSE